MEDAQGHAAAAEFPFLRELARQFRDHGGPAAWDGLPDAEAVAPLLGRRDRRRGGRDAEPDPEVYWRIELFYRAVAVAIEARTGVACTPMLRMHHEAAGRVVVVAGRLVVVSKNLRDAHRFGFDDLSELVDAGERAVASGVALVERFPELARYPG
jgi:probable nitrogen fixation protein